MSHLGLLLPNRAILMDVLLQMMAKLILAVQLRSKPVAFSPRDMFDPRDFAMPSHPKEPMYIFQLNTFYHSILPCLSGIVTVSSSTSLAHAGLLPGRAYVRRPSFPASLFLICHMCIIKDFSMSNGH